MRKLIIFPIFFAILFIVACSNDPRSIPIFTPYSSVVDTISPKLWEFLKNSKRSWHAEHCNIFRDNPENLVAILNSEESQLLVFNAISNTINHIRVQSKNYFSDTQR